MKPGVGMPFRPRTRGPRGPFSPEVPYNAILHATLTASQRPASRRTCTIAFTELTWEPQNGDWSNIWAGNSFVGPVHSYRLRRWWRRQSGRIHPQWRNAARDGSCITSVASIPSHISTCRPPGECGLFSKSRRAPDCRREHIRTRTCLRAKRRTAAAYSTFPLTQSAMLIASNTVAPDAATDSGGATLVYGEDSVPGDFTLHVPSLSLNFTGKSGLNQETGLLSSTALLVTGPGNFNYSFPGLWIATSTSTTTVSRSSPGSKHQSAPSRHWVQLRFLATATDSYSTPIRSDRNTTPQVRDFW